MGHIKPLLLAFLALNVYHVLCEPNKRLLEQLVERKITFLTTNNLETCNVTMILPSEDKYHQALGFMRGLHAIEVTWHVPLYNKEDKMSDVYRRLDVIAKKINTKHHCSKFDMIDDYSILFYFRAIRYLGVKLYAMLSTTPLTSLIQASEILNQITKFKMLSADDIIAFATQMVKSVSTLHEIEYALGSIEPKNFGIWKFTGRDGKEQKRFVHTELKSTKERTNELVKTNWLEVLATISEVMGAYDRSKELKETGYNKRIGKWVFPTENLEKLVRRNMKSVNKDGALEKNFVDNLKTNVEEWHKMITGNKDAKSMEDGHYVDTVEDNPTGDHHQDHDTNPRIRTRRNSLPNVFQVNGYQRYPGGPSVSSYPVHPLGGHYSGFTAPMPTFGTQHGYRQRAESQLSRPH